MKMEILHVLLQNLKIPREIRGKKSNMGKILRNNSEMRQMKKCLRYSKIGQFKVKTCVNFYLNKRRLFLNSLCFSIWDQFLKL